MGTAGCVVLAPECIPEDSPIRTKADAIARDLRVRAGSPGVQVQQFYIAVDVFAKDEVNLLENIKVGEVNTRGPGIPVEAVAPHQALATRLAETAIRQYNAAA